MITSAQLAAFDSRGVRYQATVMRSGASWSISVETVPPVTFLGTLMDAVDYAAMSLERAVANGEKPALTVEEAV